MKNNSKITCSLYDLDNFFFNERLFRFSKKYKSEIIDFRYNFQKDSEDRILSIFSELYNGTILIIVDFLYTREVKTYIHNLFGKIDSWIEGEYSFTSFKFAPLIYKRLKNKKNYIKTYRIIFETKGKDLSFKRMIFDFLNDSLYETNFMITNRITDFKIKMDNFRKIIVVEKSD